MKSLYVFKTQIKGVIQVKKNMTGRRRNHIITEFLNEGCAYIRTKKKPTFGLC